jgi:hypothetical protein
VTALSVKGLAPRRAVSDEDRHLRVTADEDQDDEDRDERGGYRGDDLSEPIGRETHRTPPARDDRDDDSGHYTSKASDDGDE